MTIRKLKNATITHVSYVDKGANKKQFFLTKSLEDPTIEKDVKILVNKEDEKQLVYGVVYEPDTPDAHNDMMDAAEIEKSAHLFLADYRNIDKQHDFQGGYGEVVESYVAPQDFEVGGETIAKGSWVLVTKADDETWEAIQKGEITGYSMAGMAEVEEVEKQQEKKFFQMMKDFFTKGELKDNYNATRKRRNMFDALWMFEDYIIDEIYKDSPDTTKLVEHIQDFAEILTQLATSTELIKELQNDDTEREELQMKKEDLQELLKEAMAPINEKLEKLEKEAEGQEEETPAEGEEVTKAEGKEEETAEDLKKELAAVIKEELAPINDRLEKVEKARGVSKSVEGDAEGAEGKADEESVFKSLFTMGGQL